MNAVDIVKFFMERGGFESWWYSIDEDIRKEILSDLQARLNE